MFRRLEMVAAEEVVLAKGQVRLDNERHEVSVGGMVVQLTATEFRLLRALMAANGRVLSRGHLIEAVMGTGITVTDRTIDVHITSLRKKLDTAASWLQTIRGVGYAFRENS